MSKYEIDEETGEVLFNHSVIYIEDVVDRLNDLEARLAESEERANRYKSWHNEKAGECAELKEQLAEKEKEIDELKAQRHIYLNRSVEECNKITDLEFELQHKHQDKISFAVEQLEKVKEFIFEQDIEITRLNKIYDFMDKQINQLKEKK